MSKHLRETSLKVVRAVRTVEAGIHLVPVFICLIVILLLTLYFGLNIVTFVIDLVLAVQAVSSVFKACELYGQVPPPPATEDRRRFLGNENLMHATRQQDRLPARNRQNILR